MNRNSSIFVQPTRKICLFEMKTAFFIIMNKYFLIEMSISSPDDVDYIDTESPLIAPKMEEESSSIETVYTPSEKVKILKKY